MCKLLNFLIALLISLICFSCKTKITAKFEIINTTNEKIDSFYILPTNLKNNFIQLEPNSKSLYNFDMTELPKNDGSYGLSFKTKTKNVFIGFGYYTNGYPMESLTKIFINSDTVIVKPEYKNKY